MTTPSDSFPLEPPSIRNASLPDSLESHCAFPPAHDWRFLTAATGLIALALILRLYKIGFQEFWVDEGYSYLLATAPDWFGPATMANNTPPLYHFLLRGWMAVAGQDEAGLRLLSALFGTLGVGALIWAGREIFTPTVGLWSGAFAALAPIHIYYSQEARTYALLMLALTLTYVLLWRALRRNTGGAWALAAVAATLALYSHYLAVFGLLPTVLLPWTLPHDQRTGQRWRRYLLAMSAALLLLAPWAIISLFVASHPLDDSSSSWMNASWKHLPPALAIPKSLEILGLGGQAGLTTPLVKQFSLVQLPPWSRLLGLAALALLFLGSAVPWGDKLLGIQELWRRKVWLGLLLFFPLIALWLISYFVKPVYLVTRYDVVAFPAYALLVGLTFTKLQRCCRRGTILVAVAALALGIPLGVKLFLYYDAPTNRSAHILVELLDASVENDDLIIFTGPFGHSLLYYLSRLGFEWDSGLCRNRATGRRFYCRFVPIENERTLVPIAGRSTMSAETMLKELQAVTAPLGRDRGSVVVVFEIIDSPSGGRPGSRFSENMANGLNRLGFEIGRARSEVTISFFHRFSETENP